MSQNSLQTSGPIKASEVDQVLGDTASNQPLVKLSEYYSDAIGPGHFNNPNEETQNFGTHPGSLPLFNPHLSSDVHMRLESAAHSNWATGSIRGPDGVSLNSFIINFGQSAPVGSTGEADAIAFGAKVSVGDRIGLNVGGVNSTQAAAIDAATTSLTHFFTNTDVKVTNVVTTGALDNFEIVDAPAVISANSTFDAATSRASLTSVNLNGQGAPASVVLISRWLGGGAPRFAMQTIQVTSGGSGFSPGDIVNVPMRASKIVRYDASQDVDETEIYSATLNLTLNVQPTFRVLTTDNIGAILTATIQEAGNFFYSGDTQHAGFEATGTGFDTFEPYVATSSPELYPTVPSTNTSASGIVRGEGFTAGQIIDIPLPVSRDITVFDTAASGATPTFTTENPPESFRSYSSVGSTISNISSVVNYNGSLSSILSNVPANTPQSWRVSQLGKNNIDSGDYSEWMQIDLGESKAVAGVVTQGRVNSQFVRTFFVEHSNDGFAFSSVDSGNIFTGNTDGATEVTNMFTVGVVARYIRIYPVTYNDNGTDDMTGQDEGWPSMRAGVVTSNITTGEITYNAALTVYTQPTMEVITVDAAGGILTLDLENAGSFVYIPAASPTNKFGLGTGFDLSNVTYGAGSSEFTVGQLAEPEGVSASISFDSEFFSTNYGAPASIFFRDIGNGSYYDWRLRINVISIPSGGTGSGFAVNDIVDIPLALTETHYSSDDDGNDYTNNNTLTLFTQPTFRVNAVDSNGKILAASIENGGSYYYSGVGNSRWGLPGGSHAAESRNFTGSDTLTIPSTDNTAIAGGISTRQSFIKSVNVIPGGGGSGFAVNDIVDVPLQSSSIKQLEDNDGDFSLLTNLILNVQPTFKVTGVGSDGEITSAQVENSGNFVYSSALPGEFDRLPAAITMTSASIGSYNLGSSFQMATISIPSGGTGSGFSVGEILNVPLVSSKHGWFYESDDETSDTYYYSGNIGMPESPLILNIQPTIKVLTVGTQGEILTAQIEEPGSFRYYSVASSSYNFGKVNVGAGNSPPLNVYAQSDNNIPSTATISETYSFSFSTTKTFGLGGESINDRFNNAIPASWAAAQTLSVASTQTMVHPSNTVAIQFNTEFKAGAGGASIADINQMEGLLGMYSTTPSDDPNLGIVNNHLTFSRPISFGDLYGDSRSFVHTITSNQTDLNLNTYLVEQGWNQNERVLLTIASTAHIHATSTSNYALTVGAFPQGLVIINNGKITGKGGNGGGTNGAGASGQAGSNAGPAIHFTAPSEYIITNNGFICGGGGGGASGSSAMKSGGGGGAGGGNGGYGDAEYSENAGGVGATVPGNAGGDGAEDSDGKAGHGGQAGGSGGTGRDTSDRRLKRNIKWVAKSSEGINIYEFKYLWGFKTYRGVMAQELLDTHPQAIKKGLFGFYKVNYNLIDVKFEVL